VQSRGIAGVLGIFQLVIRIRSHEFRIPDFPRFLRADHEFTIWNGREREITLENLVEVFSAIALEQDVVATEIDCTRHDTVRFQATGELILVSGLPCFHSAQGRPSKPVK
jgi:hypothetical protein